MKRVNILLTKKLVSLTQSLNPVKATPAVASHHSPDIAAVPVGVCR